MISNRARGWRGELRREQTECREPYWYSADPQPPQQQPLARLTQLLLQAAKVRKHPLRPSEHTLTFWS